MSNIFEMQTYYIARASESSSSLVASGLCFPLSLAMYIILWINIVFIYRRPTESIIVIIIVNALLQTSFLLEQFVSILI